MEEKEDWGSKAFEESSRQSAELLNVNHKKVVMPLLFVVITGKKQGPPLFDSVQLLGKERTRARILTAIQKLGGLSAKQVSNLKEMWQNKKSL